MINTIKRKRKSITTMMDRRAIQSFVGRKRVKGRNSKYDRVVQLSPLNSKTSVLYKSSTSVVHSKSEQTKNTTHAVRATQQMT
jgi:hypothetical protein